MPSRNRTSYRYCSNRKIRQPSVTEEVRGMLLKSLWDRPICDVLRKRNPNQSIIRDDDTVCRVTETSEFKDYYPYISLEVIDFLYRMKYVPRRGRFLDVGCGIGDKLFIAANLGFTKADGIEVRKEYIDLFHVAKKRTKRYNKHVSKTQVFHADALEFTDYGSYDCIYFYVPIANRHKMTRLFHTIIANAKIGSYIVPVGMSYNFQTTQVDKQKATEFLQRFEE